MAQRIEPADSLDDYPTPPWGTRAGVQHALYCDDEVPFALPPAPSLTIYEPAANRGHMVHPLREYFGTVHASDVYDYGVGFPVRDFLAPAADDLAPDLVITNPPFSLATEFVKRAMAISKLGCAVLVRSSWLESDERYQLCQLHRPALVAQFAERLPMLGGYIAKGASTATSYAWVCFLHRFRDTRWRHIPPCKRRLERNEDYPDWAEQARLMAPEQLLRLLARHVADVKTKPRMPEAVLRAEIGARGIEAPVLPPCSSAEPEGAPAGLLCQPEDDGRCDSDPLVRGVEEGQG